MSKLRELVVHTEHYVNGKRLAFPVIVEAEEGFLITDKNELQEIIYRCNCHDELVTGCEDALIGISEASVKFEHKHCKVGQAILTKTFRIIEAALAKVKK